MSTTNDPNFLVPPLLASSTRTMMDNSYSVDASISSEQNSPDSSRSKSPLTSFDIPLDPSDPLSFLMDAHSGDSSTEESFTTTNTPPSSHNSPSVNLTAKDSTMEWPEAQFTYPYESSNPAVNVMNAAQFDASYIVGEQLALWLDPNNTAQAPDLSTFGFSFDPNAFGSLHVPTSTESSGSSVASTSSSPAMEKAQVGERAQLPAASVVQKSVGAQPTQQPQPMTVPTGASQLSGNQLFDELTQLVKSTAGVSVALPIGLEVSNTDNGQGAAKLPIPRLQRPMSVSSAVSQANKRKSSSASSVPSIASQPTQPDISSSPIPVSAPAPTRTKTSHTTIERRYRTNLNARIQSLRAAVPALRVLEMKPGNRVGNLAIKAGTRRAGVDADPGADEDDVIDERGYIDGVKVARKGSKANVLGKATEYIRVLKRREHRLKHEQDGLKTLIRSLVGGPALLKEWETMWRERFGGPEKDEVECEEGEADDENDDENDDEDGDEDQEEDGSGAGKKRKRTRVETKKKTTPPVPIAKAQPQQIMPQAHSFTVVSEPASMRGNPVAPEKRKRGRPRKNPLPASVSTDNIQDVFLMQQQQPMMKMEVDPQAQQMHVQMQPQQVVIKQQQPQPAQYLLAAFAFFSFFNGPTPFYKSSGWADHNSRPTAHEHTHTGAVLGTHYESGPPPPKTSSTHALGWGLHDVVQILHIVISFLLLFSIITPWLPRVIQGRISRAVPRALKPLLGGSLTSESHVSQKAGRTPPPTGRNSDDESANEKEKADSIARSVLLAAIREGKHAEPAQEAQILRDALGLGSGPLGLMMSLSRFVGSSRKSRSRFGLERRMLEQKAGLRLAELAALEARTSLSDRIQVYLFAFKFLSTFTASASDLATLALVVRPFWRTKAVSLWSLALNRAQGKGSLRPQISRAHERFILESMSVDDAMKAVAKLDYAESMWIHQAHPSAPEDTDDESESGSSASDEPGEYSSPLAVLARHVVRDYVRDHAERVFLQTVADEVVIGEGDRQVDENAEHDFASIVNAGRTLDPQTSKLVELFDRVCNPTSLHLNSMQDLSKDDEEKVHNTEDAEAERISALLHAITLYRQIFPSTLLSVPSCGDDRCKASGPSPISISLTPMPSPPPSPSRQNRALHLLLRRYLYSPAFDRLDELEDARDRVVDLLTSEAALWPKRLHY